ncbi:MAG: hypothetical protein V9G04_13765 [Nocardioides sp.]
MHEFDPSAASQQVPGSEAAGSSKRLVAVAFAAGLSLVLLLALGGFFGFRYWKAKPIKDDFVAAQKAFAPVVESMESATSIADVATAADGAEIRVGRSERVSG